jgi:crotonobetainyl-CoA:carnitine CoA-transferase CaiB-like acyl-CoA transferase
MDGFRVVELGVWVAAPAAGAILADWGADVIKIEPPTGERRPRSWYR